MDVPPIEPLPPVIEDVRPAADPGGAAAGGDVYVATVPTGGAIRLDGVDTGQRAPAMLRGVVPGGHLVEVELGCGRARAEVVVAAGTIARAELALVDVPGRLTVHGEPAGAVVRVDDVEVGALPWEGEIRCGAHRVDVTADGYLRSGAPVDVVADGDAAVEVSLVPEHPGTLTVDVTPIDARVAMDGRPLGEGPRTVDGVAPGPHSVEASRDGYRSRRASIAMEPGGAARVELVLTPGREPGPVPRGLLAGGVAVVGVAAGAWSAWEFASANEAYQAFLVEPDDRAAVALYQDGVRPHETRGWVAAGVSAATLLGAGALWVLPLSGGAAAGIGGTF